MASQIDQTLTVLVSVLQTTGVFSNVDTVEPKSPPDSGVIVAAVWFSTAKPVGQVSGLDKGTVLYEFTVRLYSNLLQIPADQIDRTMVRTVDLVFDALCGDFELGGTIRNIDILGEVSAGLNAKTGHVDVGGILFRAVDINVPMIVNDVIDWSP